MLFELYKVRLWYFDGSFKFKELMLNCRVHVQYNVGCVWSENWNFHTDYVMMWLFDSSTFSCLVISLSLQVAHYRPVTRRVCSNFCLSVSCFTISNLDTCFNDKWSSAWKPSARSCCIVIDFFSVTADLFAIFPFRLNCSLNIFAWHSKYIYTWLNGLILSAVVLMYVLLRFV